MQKKLMCAGCKRPLDKKYIKALGKVWHLEHFKCAKCSKTLSTQTFFERNGLAYCKNDYLNLFCHKCSKCDEYITQEIVKAIGKFWHVSCFTCTTCNKPIQPPYFFEKEGKPYCNDDYAKNFAPICKACGQYIFEDYLKVLGGTWHTNCFTCKDCKQPIKKNIS
ncbi:hypothetical protein HHI36_007073 [Cryptolaemus montrouzieri]|uniref:LIM zinc-binding domain-containing protein n=1 Tax=Cryptolaemus montrouzieri TaxID=559131 RepID=A0ABD2MNI6_9CUCU